MSRLNPHQGLVPSIVDRLIDPESAGTAAREGYSVAQMTDVVRRDLEDLLNTRQSYSDIPNDFPELRRSIMAYGLPDLASFNAVSVQQRQAIGRVIEAVIRQYEPRLRDVHAIMVNPGDDKSRTVAFRVEARLRVDPAPEVSFDTVLELTTGQYSVQKPS